jgi:formylglycine-generating enzyme required for sulfatase activity
MTPRARSFFIPVAVALTASLSITGGQEAPSGGTEPQRTNTLGMKFVEIPGTTVLFAVNETRVSDYQAFVQDAQYAWTFKPHFEQSPAHPVVGVSLQDAVAFCNWLTEKERRGGQINSSQSYRLPTNREWSSAAGLGSARKEEASLDEKIQDERSYVWGLQWPPPPKVANFMEQEIQGYSDGFPFTAPVGQFPPTPEGVHDLSGNVWEWVWDREMGALPSGTLRGGSWAYFRQECLTSAYRYEVPAELRASTIGFRCIFEDKNRTATLLAAANQSREEARKQQAASVAGGKVDSKEVEMLKQKILGGGDTASTGVRPDISKLKPAEKDKPYMNSIGMEFLPLNGLPLLAGATEVRVREYELWINSTDGAWDMKPSFLEDTHPAVAVSWEDANAFCAWLTKRDLDAKLIPATARYRLPTDAEWSALAGMPEETGADPSQKHLGNKTHYPWGNDLWPPPPLSVNIQAAKIGEGFRDNYSYTSPVGILIPNSKSFHDLAGNASEWCEDVWPGAEDERVVRGGSWLSSDKTALLSSHRNHLVKSSRRSDIGFRCMLQLE